MIQVQDLRIESEILPLLNFTHNSHAEEALRRLLLHLPTTLEVVRERQAIITGMLAHWDVLEGFTYSKIEFRDVYNFLCDVTTGQVVLETNQVKAHIKLLLSEQERYQRRAKYVQTLRFLHRLYQHYLGPLRQVEFPESFRRQLSVLSFFLERFSLEANVTAIQQDAFSVGHAVQMARVLSCISEEELHAFWTAFYEFEAYWSLANGVQRHGFVFPSFGDAGLELVDFYHPLVPNAVKNTLTLRAGENVVLLTGPNMSGKSTLLKAVSLCVYLAHAGVGVPAAQCEIPFFDSIAVAVNLSDSLQDGYSHFMMEIQNLKAVLQTAHSRGRAFAVFDELFRGTNADDALEITRATVGGLRQFRDSFFFISTHLLQLDSLVAEQDCVKKYYIDCTLTNGVPVFTYRLLPGWSTLKIGQLLFQREGLHQLLAQP